MLTIESGGIVRAGDFTVLRYIKDLGLQELEARCGFDSRRLAPGACIAVMEDGDLASLTADEIALGASSRWSRSDVAKWAPDLSLFEEDGKTKMAHDAIQMSLSIRGKDTFLLRQKVVEFFRKEARNAPAKVFPNVDHEDGMLYPSAKGVGVPQYKLLKPKKWRVVKVLAPL